MQWVKINRGSIYYQLDLGEDLGTYSLQFVEGSWELWHDFEDASTRLATFRSRCGNKAIDSAVSVLISQGFADRGRAMLNRADQVLDLEIPWGEGGGEG